MTSVPIYNVVVPFVGFIEGGLYPGRMVRIQGMTSPIANRFGINLQCGANTVPRDDIALHISCRFPENTIVRNSLQCMSWGPEENVGPMPLYRGQSFEIIILCDPAHYKIAINGQHYTEFIHRLPYQRVSHLAIDGDVTINLVCYEGGYASSPGFASVPHAAPGYIPPPGPMVYPPMPSTVPGPYPSYSTPPDPYPSAPGSYPPTVGPYPSQPGYQQSYGQPYPPQGGSYPPPPPGYHSPSHKKGGGVLDKAQAAVSNILGPRTGAGVAGTALGAGLAGAALSGHLSPKKAFKAHKKSHKKALKYGLPLAGVGLGAYALKKGFHGHSSSSSSSSSEEE